MQKVHILENNESKEKIAYYYSLDASQVVQGKDKIMDKKYVVLEQGCENVKLIKNYFPPFVYFVKTLECKDKIKSAGFSVKDDAEVGDILLLQKNQGIKHVVKPMETLDDIAKSYQTQSKEIIEQNQLKTDRLFIGQILWI